MEQIADSGTLPYPWTEVKHALAFVLGRSLRDSWAPEAKDLVRSEPDRIPGWQTGGLRCFGAFNHLIVINYVVT